MKVLVLGGYGEFGGRLCHMLLRDGHSVIVAGRTLEKARAFCDRHGGDPLQVNSRGDLGAVCEAAPDAVVDCIGPYQAYGDDPHRVARFAIENGMHYLDIADDGEFAERVSELNDLAVARGVIALSGASSTPAITSSAVTELIRDLDTIDLVEAAILPGSRAPRGRSTMEAILGQIGKPFRSKRSGRWTDAIHWSRTRKIRLAHDLKRNAAMFGAADAHLLPRHFKVGSVIFRAGLELPIMHHALRMLGWLRQKKLVADLRFLITPLEYCARLLVPLGTDRGGMLIEVTGRERGSEKRVRNGMYIVSEAGVGPNIPAVPSRALLRTIESLEPGARPCVSELPVQKYLDAMSDLAITSRVESNTYRFLFEDALGAQWKELQVGVQDTHEVIDCLILRGHARIERGTSLLARIASVLFRFPAAGDGVELVVSKFRENDTEIWERRFAGRLFKSSMNQADDGMICERFGLFRYGFDLSVSDGALYFTVARGWFAGIPIPTPLLPHVEAREWIDSGNFNFDVRLCLPITRAPVVRYTGQLRPDSAQTD